MRTRRYRELLDASAGLVALPTWRDRHPQQPELELTLAGPVWFEGLVLTESAGDPAATRYEPHQDRAGRHDAVDDADTPGRDDGTVEDDTSYGLCQVMGYNIRRLVGVPPGTPMDFRWALLPITNVSLGLRVLVHELAQTHQNVSRALARYNGGPTGDRGFPGPMRRQVYVDKVRDNAVRVLEDRSRKESP